MTMAKPDKHFLSLCENSSQLTSKTETSPGMFNLLLKKKFYSFVTWRQQYLCNATLHKHCSAILNSCCHPQTQSHCISVLVHFFPALHFMTCCFYLRHLAWPCNALPLAQRRLTDFCSSIGWRTKAVCLSHQYHFAISSLQYHGSLLDIMEALCACRI